MSRLHHVVGGLTVILATIGALGSGCPLVPAPLPVLTHSYTGLLELQYTQEMPPISETVRMNVRVERDGRVTIGPATLNYDGLHETADTRLQQTGTIALAPTGAWHRDGDVDHIAVVEHGTGSDHLQMWGLVNGQWVQFVDETRAVNWTGGLDFRLDEATMAGAVVASDAGAFRVRWTLGLAPELN
jgi:hypothetical protein